MLHIDYRQEKIMMKKQK